MTGLAARGFEAKRFAYPPSIIFGPEEKGVSQVVLERLRPSQRQFPAVAPRFEQLGRLDAAARELQEKSDWAGARRLLEQALAIRETELGLYHADTAANIYDLCLIASSQNDLDAVHHCIKRILHIQLKILGPDDPAIADTLDALGRSLSDLGKPAEVLPVLQRSLALRNYPPGFDDSDTIETVKYLAVAHWELGHLDDACHLIKRIISFRENKFGPDHVETAEAVNWIAAILRDKGESEQAQHYFLRAAVIFEREFGTLSLKFADILYAIALNAQDIEPEDVVYALLKRSLYIKEQVLGRDNIDLDGAQIIEIIAYHELRPGPSVEITRAYLDWALETRERILGPEDPRTEKVREYINELALIEYRRRKGTYIVHIKNLFDQIKIDNIAFSNGGIVRYDNLEENSKKKPFSYSGGYQTEFSEKLELDSVRKIELIASILSETLQLLKTDDEKQSVLSAMFNEAIGGDDFVVTVSKNVRGVPAVSPRLWSPEDENPKASSAAGHETELEKDTEEHTSLPKVPAALQDRVTQEQYRAWQQVQNERARASRAQESLEKAEKRRAKIAEGVRATRAKMTPKQVAERRTKEAERIRAKRKQAQEPTP